MRTRRPLLKLVVLPLAFGVALASAAPPAGAQTAARPTRRNLAGVIYDAATGRPLVAAAVEIGPQQVLTDTAGRFLLAHVPDGPATIEVQQLGYAPGALALEVTGDLPPLRLALRPDPVMLKAITVMADRFRSRRSTVPYDVRAFDRRELLDWRNATVRDFLTYRAGVVSGACPTNDGSLASTAPSAASAIAGGASTEGAFGVAAPSVPFGEMGTGGTMCALVRGQWIEPSIWIDDRHAFANELTTYRPGELFLVEVYGRGRMIRAYTTWWVAAMANRPLTPIY